MTLPNCFIDYMTGMNLIVIILTCGFIFVLSWITRLSLRINSGNT